MNGVGGFQDNQQAPVGTTRVRIFVVVVAAGEWCLVCLRVVENPFLASAPIVSIAVIVIVVVSALPLAAIVGRPDNEHVLSVCVLLLCVCITFVWMDVALD